MANVKNVKVKEHRNSIGNYIEMVGEPFLLQLTPVLSEVHVQAIDIVV